MAAPVVPQRPSRSQNPQAPSANPGLDAPRIPPRPVRASDRSKSRDRDAYSRSPLNDTSFGMTPANMDSSIYSHSNESGSNTHLPRPPSVQALPLIGQEGMEYASLEPQEEQQVAHSSDLAASPNESRIASDLPIHAPKASLPISSAKARVATVTRTDSSKAAVAGIGKAQTEYDEHPNRPPSSGHYRPPSAVSSSRPTSAAYNRTGDTPELEQGIPEIGMQVPMNPMAGDVQMPTPTPGSAGGSTGIGFFNDGSRPESTHGRRKSAQFQNPPGSYGLHGHGVLPHDQLEKTWYQRHPEELAKEEHGAYGPASAIERGPSAMSSDDLNKLVRETSAPGFGTSETMIGAPTEAMGYMASEEYAARVKAAKLAQGHYAPAQHSALHPARSRGSRPGSQSYAESPLRNSSFPEEISHQHAVGDSETEDEKLHMKPSSRRHDKWTGGGIDTVDLGPQGGNTEELGGWVDEQGPGTPILASDEIAKNPGAEYLQPAVSPTQPLHESEYYNMDSDAGMTPLTTTRSKSRSRPSSRPTSRPGSIHGHHGLSRFVSHDHHHHDTGTPLEEIEEYEPLFKDDDDASKRGPSAEKLKKRLHLEKQRFPSKDIWEDTPTSLQLQTTVETPDEDESKKLSPKMNKTAASFEHPDREQERKGEVLESERPDFLSDEKKGFAKPKFGSHLHEEASFRPGLSQRFPSRDVWEDTPDSLNLHTTVGEAQMSTSPPENKAPLPTKPATMTQIVSKENVSTEKPAVPARPTRQKPSVTTAVETARKSSGDSLSPEKTKIGSPSERKAPSIPDRPKPQVPSRPARSSGTARSTEEPTLRKTTSASSNNSNEESALATSPPAATAVKVKPTVPSRPHAGSGKIASLKAGFMNDLNSRLQLGPQASKPSAKEEEKGEEKHEEDKPLSDARKGRARGPARRKPAAASPSPGSGASSSAVGAGKLGFSTPKTTWHIPNDARAHLQLGNIAPISEGKSVAPLAKDTESRIEAQAPERTAAESSELTKEPSHTEVAAQQQKEDPERLPSTSEPSGEPLSHSSTALETDSNKGVGLGILSATTETGAPGSSSEVAAPSETKIPGVSDESNTTDQASKDLLSIDSQPMERVISGGILGTHESEVPPETAALAEKITTNPADLAGSDKATEGA